MLIIYIADSPYDTWARYGLIKLHGAHLGQTHLETCALRCNESYWGFWNLRSK